VFVLSKAVAQILRKKAQSDFSAAVVLANADPPMDDETVGLHLQQAVEKAAKALMTSRNIKYPFTHDIDTLFQMLKAKGWPVPGQFADLDTLTPFATQARYERAVPRGSFDRAAFIDLARDFLVWTDTSR
jgi:HEPN domain-containing protein